MRSLIRSEFRAILFVCALTTSALIASRLNPDPLRLVLGIVGGYTLALCIYVFNAIADQKEDRINSPRRPLPSGTVKEQDAKLMAIFSGAVAFLMSFLIDIPTLILFGIAFLLGIAYSQKAIRAKRYASYKLIVVASGSALASLTGGVVGGKICPTVMLASTVFALFALVTVILGDIADFKGDVSVGSRTLPILVGKERALDIITAAPIVLIFLAFISYPFTGLNYVFLVSFSSVCAYSSRSMAKLHGWCEDINLCRDVKFKMRLVHLFLQISFVTGLIPIIL